MKKSQLLLSILMLLVLFVCNAGDALAQEYTPENIPWDKVHFNKTMTVRDEKSNIIQSVNLDSNNHVAEWVVYGSENPADPNYVIPETVTYEGEDYTVIAMKGYSIYVFGKYTSIELPQSMRFLNKYALYSFWNIKEIKLPAKVEFISSQCFYLSDGYMQLQFEGNTPPVIEDVKKWFYSYSESQHIFLHCPERSLEAYIAAFNGATPLPVFIEGPQGRQHNIHIDHSGNLATKIIDAAGDFRFVNNLTITGTLNNADWKTLLTALPNLNTLNLSEAKTNKATLDFSNYITGSNKNYSIETLSLPQGATTISNYSQFNALRNLVIPEGVKSISNSGSASRISNVTLPSTIEEIGNNAFYKASNLTDFSFPENVKYIGSDAFYGVPFRNLILPEGIVMIESSAFGTNPLLETATLPSTLRYCNQIFSSCDNLQRITCHAVLPPFFSGRSTISSGTTTTARTITLECPAISQSLYESSQNWQVGTFAGIDGEIGGLHVSQPVELTLDNTTIPLLNLQPSIYTHSANYMKPAYLVLNSGDQVRFNHAAIDYSCKAMAFRAANSRYPSADETNAYNSIFSFIPAGKAKADITTFRLKIPNCQWASFCPPVNISLAQFIADNANIPIVVYKHAPSVRADGMIRYEKGIWQQMNSGTLEAGKGYIITVNDATLSSGTEISLTFNAIADEQQQGLFRTDFTTQLEENISEFPHNTSWNAVGNPYPCYYDIKHLSTDAPVIVWDSRVGYDKFYTYSPVDDNYVLAPGQMFYIQRPLNTDGELHFAPEGRLGTKDPTTASAKALSSAVTERKVFNLVISSPQNSTTDQARIVFNPQALDTYEIGRDAVKFASEDSQAPIIYTLYNNCAYAINERPATTSALQLGISVPEDGDYTFSLDAPEKVIITDTFTDTSCTLLPGGQASVTIPAGTWVNRYFITLGNNVTAIDELHVSVDKANDQHLFDIQGRRLTDSQQKGIYIKNEQKFISK